MENYQKQILDWILNPTNNKIYIFNKWNNYRPEKNKRKLETSEIKGTKVNFIIFDKSL